MWNISVFPYTILANECRKFWFLTSYFHGLLSFVLLLMKLMYYYYHIIKVPFENMRHFCAYACCVATLPSSSTFIGWKSFVYLLEWIRLLRNYVRRDLKPHWWICCCFAYVTVGSAPSSLVGLETVEASSETLEDSMSSAGFIPAIIPAKSVFNGII